MDVREQIAKLEGLDYSKLYQDDFLLTWDKSDDEIRAVLAVADALRGLREQNKSCRIFDSGLGISLFRDNSTRTRFSYASACNFLGLEEQVFDEGKSQVAHGETVMETANMIALLISFLPAFLLSGFAFPLDSIPRVLQWVSYLTPGRYMVAISRGVFLKGAGFEQLWPQLAALSLYTVVLVALAGLIYRRRYA